METISMLPKGGSDIEARDKNGATALIVAADKGNANSIDALLDAVPGTNDRMLVCRLAAAVITADGRVTHDERLVYDHALARWRINQCDVTQAILDDRVR